MASKFNVCNCLRGAVLSFEQNGISQQRLDGLGDR